MGIAAATLVQLSCFDCGNPGPRNRREEVGPGLSSWPPAPTSQSFITHLKTFLPPLLPWSTSQGLSTPLPGPPSPVAQTRALLRGWVSPHFLPSHSEPNQRSFSGHLGPLLPSMPACHPQCSGFWLFPQEVLPLWRWGLGSRLGGLASSAPVPPVKKAPPGRQGGEDPSDHYPLSFLTCKAWRAAPRCWLAGCSQELSPPPGSPAEPSEACVPGPPSQHRSAGQGHS